MSSITVMMPSRVFFRVLSLLQRNLSLAECTGGEWDILKTECGDANQVMYKYLSLVEALMVAAHAMVTFQTSNLFRGDRIS
jgi:hypothetical protein